MSGLKRAMNRFPEMLLCSPLHGLMKNTLLITFTGRKSGKRYTTPIVYLRGGAPVTLRVRGEEHAALGEAVTDEVEVARVLEAMLREYPGYAKHVGLKPGDRTDLARIEEVARERVTRSGPGWPKSAEPSGGPVKSASRSSQIRPWGL